MFGMGKKNTIKIILLIFGVLAVSSLASIPSADAATFTATLSGDWDDPATWGGAAPPISIAVARENHLDWWLRRVPYVQSGRTLPRVRLQPEREPQRQHERFHR